MPGEYNNCELFPAATTNYRRGRIARIDRLIIHVTQSDGIEGVISWFASPRPKAPSSAHYTVSRTGRIVQHVREGDTAYAAPNYNGRGLHIEHEGWVDRTVFPAAQLEASAKLAKHLCLKYGIARTRACVLGHSELEGNDHSDPGSKWPWKLYMSMLQDTGPLVTPIWLHKDGMKVTGAPVYGLNWPAGTHTAVILADDRWQVYLGKPERQIKLLLSSPGARRLTAIAYDANHQVLAKDELDVVVDKAA